MTELERAHQLTQLIDRAVSDRPLRSGTAVEPQAADEDP